MTNLRKILQKSYEVSKSGPLFCFWAQIHRDLRTILRQFSNLTILGQLANSHSIYDNRKTYLKTTCYDQLLDVL